MANTKVFILEDENIVAKDTTGAATEYKIIIDTEFKILSSAIIKIFL